MPAAFTAALSGPSSCSILVTAVLICSGSVTFACMATARPPSLTMSATTPGRSALGRSTQPTDAPEAATASAIALPIPLPAPVTIATPPSSR